VEALKFCIYNVIALPFGWYVLLETRESWNLVEPFRAKCKSFGFKFLPIYVIAPVAYWWSFYFYQASTLHMTFLVMKIIGVILAVIGVIFGLEWLINTDSKKISLVRASLNASVAFFYLFFHPNHQEVKDHRNFRNR